MDESIYISIRYSSESHPILIEEFKKNLPNKVVIESNENYSSFDSSGNNLPLVIIIYQWIFCEFGNYLLFQIFEEIKRLIQGHIKIYKNNASFELGFCEGDKNVSIKASNMDETSAKILIEKFLNDANLKEK